MQSFGEKAQTAEKKGMNRVLNALQKRLSWVGILLAFAAPVHAESLEASSSDTRSSEVVSVSEASPESDDSSDTEGFDVDLKAGIKFAMPVPGTNESIEVEAFFTPLNVDSDLTEEMGESLKVLTNNPEGALLPNGVLILETEEELELAQAAQNKGARRTIAGLGFKAIRDRIVSFLNVKGIFNKAVALPKKKLQELKDGFNFKFGNLKKEIKGIPYRPKRADWILGSISTVWRGVTSTMPVLLSPGMDPWVAVGMAVYGVSIGVIHDIYRESFDKFMASNLDAPGEEIRLRTFIFRRQTYNYLMNEVARLITGPIGAMHGALTALGQFEIFAYSVTVGLVDAILTVSRITQFKDEPLVNSRLKFVTLLAIAPWLMAEFMGYGKVIWDLDLYQIRASTIGTFVTFAALIGAIHGLPNQIRTVMKSPEALVALNLPQKAWTAVKRGIAKLKYEIPTRFGICGEYLRKLPSQFRELPEKKSYPDPGQDQDRWPDHWNGKGSLKPRKNSSVAFPKGKSWASFSAQSLSAS